MGGIDEECKTKENRDWNYLGYFVCLELFQCIYLAIS